MIDFWAPDMYVHWRFFIWASSVESSAQDARNEWWAQESIEFFACILRDRTRFKVINNLKQTSVWKFYFGKSEEGNSK